MTTVRAKVRAKVRGKDTLSKLCLALSVLLLCSLAPQLAVGAPDPAADSRAWQLRSSTLVDSAGVFLDQVMTSAASNAVPHLLLATAPAPGRVLTLSGSQINAALAEQRPDLVNSAWTAAKLVRVLRRMRPLEENELKQMLAATLQRSVVKDRGELELRLGRPWAPVQVPDELLTLNILDLPTAGVTPNFIARFEMRAGTDLVGTWQWPLQAKVWREVWIARTALMRGELLAKAALGRERRDVLTLHEALAFFDLGNLTLELAENVLAGAPLYARSVHLRPVVRRGKILDAIVQEGSLTITVRAEALEDGVPGQIVRARNLTSRREFRGKVQNEQELLVSL